jgi:hypothetical protein
MIITKIPDFEGGFITTSIEGDSVVTRSDDGSILDEEPINLLVEGEETKFGKILKCGEEVVILEKSHKLFRAKRYPFNSLLLKSKDYSFKNTHTENPITGKLIDKRDDVKSDIYQEYIKNITGEYKTPLRGLIVKLKSSDYKNIISYTDSNILKSIKKMLTDPDEIYAYASPEMQECYLFLMKDGNKQYGLNIRKSMEVIQPEEHFYKLNKYGELLYKKGSREIEKSFTDKPELVISGINFGFIIEEKRIIRKAFGFKLGKNTQNFGTRKGQERPGHKYIQRKPNPNGQGYIYLYQLPSGKQQWKDEEGNAVKGGGKAEDQPLDFKPGDIVRQGPIYGKVIQTSENLLVIDIDGKKKVIDKRNGVEKVAEMSRLKLGQDIEYKGGNWKIVQLTDNVALLRNGSGKLETVYRGLQIKKEKPLTGDQIVIGKEGFVQSNPEGYQKRKIYQEGIKEAIASGYNAVNDNKYVKLANMGGQEIEISRVYREFADEWDVKINGEKQTPFRYNDGKYYVYDIDKDGNIQALNVDKETEIEVIKAEDYKKYIAERDAEKKPEQRKLHIHYGKEKK